MVSDNSDMLPKSLGVFKCKFAAFLLPEQCCFKYGLCQNEYSKGFHALPLKFDLRRS